MKGILLLLPYLGVVSLGGFQASVVVFHSTHEAGAMIRPADPERRSRDQEIHRLQERLTAFTKQLDTWHDRYAKLSTDARAVVHGPLNALERRWIVGSHRLQALKYVSASAWPTVRASLEEVFEELNVGLQGLHDSTALAARCPPPRGEYKE